MRANLRRLVKRIPHFLVRLGWKVRRRKRRAENGMLGVCVRGVQAASDEKDE